MSRLLKVTAIIETATGWGWSPCPPSLCGCCSVLKFPVRAFLGRVAGVALFALGVSCWLARGDEQSRAAKGLVGAMVLYNLGTVVILGDAGICAQRVGIALWPAVVLHAAMAVWCIKCLWHGSRE